MRKTYNDLSRETFDESKHPRDEDGKFASKGSGGSEKSSETDKLDKKTAKEYNQGSFRKFQTGEDAVKHFEYCKQWVQSLSDSEKQSIRNYTQSGFVNLNEDLRFGLVDKQKVAALENIISRFDLKEPLTVYRVTQRRALFGANPPAVGQEIHDKGFMSTTANPRYARHILTNSINDDLYVEINVPKGKGIGAYIGDISSYGNTEWEFLINRGSTIRITSVEKINGYTFVKGELVR